MLLARCSLILILQELGHKNNHRTDLPKYHDHVSPLTIILETSFAASFTVPLLLFFYVFICLQMEDFFLLRHRSKVFAVVTWFMYLVVLAHGACVPLLLFFVDFVPGMWVPSQDSGLGCLEGDCGVFWS